MGCGSSTAASAAGPSMQRDPEDRHLDEMLFSKMKVPDFDAYLCDDLEPKLNKMIEIVNDINGCIDSIKDAAIIVCGGFVMDVDLEGATEYDQVLLQLTKADCSLLTPAEATTLDSDAKVKKADAALAKAHKALNKDMEASFAPLQLAADLLTSDAAPPSMAAFNTCLTELRAAVGPTHKVSMVVKAAGKGGASCVRLTMVKAVFASQDAPHTMEVVSVLDVAKTEEAKNIHVAQQHVADSLAGVTKAVAALEGVGITTTFTMKKKKLVPAMKGEGEGNDLREKKAAMKKAVSSANQQMFKLFKACRNANGPINIAKALVTVFESLKKKLLTMGPDYMTKLSVCPSIKVTDEGMDFDLGLKLDLPDFEGKDWYAICKELLPSVAMLVLDALIAVKDFIIELIPDFKQLAEDLNELAKSAEDVFENSGDKIKEAFGEDTFAISSALAAAAGNMKTAMTEPIKLIQSARDTLLTMNDEMQAAVTEVKGLFPTAA